MKPMTVSLALAAIAVVYYFPQAEAPHGAGVLVADEPRQGPPGNTATWEVRGYRLTPLASFSIRGRVLQRERYWLGRESGLSPLDLSLGWGLMSDDAVLRQFNIYRGHRRVYWQPRSGEARALLPQVNTHAANIHLIPATPAIASALTALQRSGIVEMGGRLVEVDGPDGWHWRSSLTREDTGDGACEVMWVEWLRAG
jgi:hypothetical protein